MCAARTNKMCYRYSYIDSTDFWDTVQVEGGSPFSGLYLRVDAPMVFLIQVLVPRYVGLWGRRVGPVSPTQGSIDTHMISWVPFPFVFSPSLSITGTHPIPKSWFLLWLYRFVFL